MQKATRSEPGLVSPQARAILEPVEVTAADVVEHADLSIDDMPTSRHAGKRAGYLWEPSRGVSAVARLQAHSAVVHFGQHAVAVVLHLEAPGGICERQLARAELHRAQLLERGHAATLAEPCNDSRGARAGSHPAA
jgi:hypothetical protein